MLINIVLDAKMNELRFTYRFGAGIGIALQEEIKDLLVQHRFWEIPELLTVLVTQYPLPIQIARHAIIDKPIMIRLKDGEGRELFHKGGCLIAQQSSGGLRLIYIPITHIGRKAAR